MIALFSTSRPFRTELDRALRAQGWLVRSASRQAELAKSLSPAPSAVDGAATVQLLIAGPSDDDHTTAKSTATQLAPQLLADGRSIMTTPAESIDEIVRRARELLPH